MNTNIERLQRLIELETQREQLETEIQRLHGELQVPAITPRTAAIEVTTPTPRNGGIREKIQELLRKAGKDGMHVSAIAQQLGMKKANVYSFFYNTGHQHGMVKTKRRGTFALKARHN